jgi:hypothetical protein
MKDKIISVIEKCIHDAYYGGSYEPEQASEELTTLIIGKALDVINAEGGQFDPSDDLEKGYDSGIEAAYKAVDKLRQLSN